MTSRQERRPVATSETAETQNGHVAGSVDLLRALANQRLQLIEDLARQLRALAESSQEKERVIAELDAAGAERLELLRSTRATHDDMEVQLTAKGSEIEQKHAEIQ